MYIIAFCKLNCDGAPGDRGCDKCVEGYATAPECCACDKDYEMNDDGKCGTFQILLSCRSQNSRIVLSINRNIVMVSLKNNALPCMYACTTPTLTSIHNPLVAESQGLHIRKTNTFFTHHSEHSLCGSIAL